jgi:hypothetical protein
MLEVAVYLYLNVFSFPHTPFLLGGDQAYFWNGGNEFGTSQNKS